MPGYTLSASDLASCWSKIPGHFPDQGNDPGVNANHSKVTTLSKSALTSRGGTMQKVRYVSTVGSQIPEKPVWTPSAGFSRFCGAR